VSIVVRNPLVRFLTAARGFGLFAVFLALMGQIATGAVVPMPEPVSEVADAALYLCHVSGATGPNQPAPSHHHHDCALCPLCQAQIHSHVILTPPLPTVLARVVLTLRTRGPAQPRAPPAALLDSHYPRGPPILA